MRKFSFAFRKQTEAKIREQAKIFAFFAIKQNAKTKQNGREKKNRETIFPFCWKPYSRVSINCLMI